MPHKLYKISRYMICIVISHDYRYCFKMFYVTKITLVKGIELAILNLRFALFGKHKLLPFEIITG